MSKTTKNSPKIVEVEKLNKSFYNNRVLEDICFDIGYGEILGIVGENGAGKSTLIKLLSGVYKPDSGIIKIDGKRVDIKDINIAKQFNISVVFQELSSFPNLSVAENIFAARQPVTKTGFVKWQDLHKETDELLKKFDVDISYEMPLARLDFADRQVIEILKALSINPRLLILDEPTSGLAEHEVDRLFKLIQDMKNHNYSIIYISHYLKEVLTVSDRIMVLRDGKIVGIFNKKDVDEQQIIHHMIGRETKQFFALSAGEAQKPEKKSSARFEARGLSLGDHFKDINFKTFRGEILGIAELSGGIKDRILKTIYGVFKPDSGQMLLDGRPLELNSEKDAISHGISYITDDRKSDGLFLGFDVKSNIVAAILKKVSRNKFIKNLEIMDFSRKFVKMMNVKIFSHEQKLRFLSGGNQQKVLISKCLCSKPDLILANDPTRGIDIGAKEDIHSIFRELAKSGVSIIYTSSEYDELLNLCDRLIAISKDRTLKYIQKQDFDIKTLLMAIN